MFVVVGGGERKVRRFAVHKTVSRFFLCIHVDVQQSSSFAAFLFANCFLCPFAAANIMSFS